MSRMVRAERSSRISTEELIRLAEVWTRLAVRARRLSGRDDESIGREVAGLFLERLEDESFGPYTDESLMLAVRRSVALALAEPHPGARR